MKKIICAILVLLLSVALIWVAKTAVPVNMRVMPKRICDVEIPSRKGTDRVYEVVEVNGLRWYADAEAMPVTGTVFRALSCTYDYETGRTLSALLKRRFDDGSSMDECKSSFLEVSRQIDDLNAGETVLGDQTISTSNSLTRIITRGDLVRIDLSLNRSDGLDCPELSLGFALPARGLSD